MTKNIVTKSQEVANDIVALLRARNSLLWVVTREEARVERYLMEAAKAAKYVPYTWDVAQGVVDANDDKVEEIGNSAEDVLGCIKERSDATGTAIERGVFILRDLPVWFGNGIIGATVLRMTRNLARSLPGSEAAQTMIVLTPSSDVPPELAGHATVIQWPLPDRAEIASILDAALGGLSEEFRAKAAPQNGQREAAIDAAVGLNGEEAESCYAKSLVQFGIIDPKAVAQEKKRIIAREKVLEWFDPLADGLNAVGGLDNLKSWLLTRTSAYSPAAKEYGLPAPKGVAVVGVSGCGKSLTAKAIATNWGVPLLRVDLGALKSKFVGESEGNLRKAFNVIEAIGRCVVWFDEIEKALQGATSGSSDGGVSADALGAILTWMEERRGEAFVIVTANDVSALPPEFLRKGRFDEVWFVDLPNYDERMAVLAAALRKYGRGDVKVDTAAVAEACNGFTGAEIAEIVPDALFAGFADGKRQINTEDLIKSANDVSPLSKTSAAKINALRDWAKTSGTRRATGDIETVREKGPARRLDI